MRLLTDGKNCGWRDVMSALRTGVENIDENYVRREAPGNAGIAKNELPLGAGSGQMIMLTRQVLPGERLVLHGFLPDGTPDWGSSPLSGNWNNLGTFENGDLPNPGVVTGVTVAFEGNSAGTGVTLVEWDNATQTWINVALIDVQNYELISNKVQTIDDSLATADQYPSALAVVNRLAASSANLTSQIAEEAYAREQVDNTLEGLIDTLTLTVNMVAGVIADVAARDVIVNPRINAGVGSMVAAVRPSGGSGQQFAQLVVDMVPSDSNQTPGSATIPRRANGGNILLPVALGGGNYAISAVQTDAKIAAAIAEISPPSGGGKIYRHTITFEV